MQAAIRREASGSVMNSAGIGSSICGSRKSAQYLALVSHIDCHLLTEGRSTILESLVLAIDRVMPKHHGHLWGKRYVAFGMAKFTVRKKLTERGGKSPHLSNFSEDKITPLGYMFKLMNDERLSPMQS